jgi:ABC-2 type transport system permease protein
MSPTLVIARREFRSYFDSPLAYVVICLSFLVLGLAFFFLKDYWQVGRATMQPLFEYAPWGLSGIVIPVVTMRLLAEEKRSGTLEMLITLPLRDSDVILGKYIGALGLVVILLAGSALYPLMMFKWPWHLGPIDMGPVWTGYFGLVLYAAAAAAVGLLVSTLAESQAVAFFVTAFVLLLFWIPGQLSEHLNGLGWLGDTLLWVSFSSRLNGFMKGLIDTRDVLFFLSVAAMALAISFRALERRKWS